MTAKLTFELGNRTDKEQCILLIEKMLEKGHTFECKFIQGECLLIIWNCDIIGLSKILELIKL